MIKTGERKKRVSVITVERNNRGCYGNTCCTILFYSLLYGNSIGIWLLGILLLWKPNLQTFHFTVN